VDVIPRDGPMDMETDTESTPDTDTVLLTDGPPTTVMVTETQAPRDPLWDMVLALMLKSHNNGRLPHMRMLLTHMSNNTRITTAMRTLTSQSTRRSTTTTSQNTRNQSMRKKTTQEEWDIEREEDMVANQESIDQMLTHLLTTTTLTLLKVMEPSTNSLNSHPSERDTTTHTHSAVAQVITHHGTKNTKDTTLVSSTTTGDQRSCQDITPQQAMATTTGSESIILCIRRA